MQSTLKVALAQVDLAVGDVAGNTAKIIDFASRARDEARADLVVFPELSICGYPPEDLLLHAGLRNSVAQAIAEITNKVFGIAVLIGFMWGVTAWRGAFVEVTGTFSAFAFMLFMMLFETLVALIQAFIFTILTAIFMSVAVAEEH